MGQGNPRLFGIFIFFILVILWGSDTLAGKSNEATKYTKSANHYVEVELPFKNDKDFTLAKNGLIDRPEKLIIKDEQGRIVWDLTAYEFLKQEKRPHTVNPSHWRQAKLNLEYGLFEVVPGIYQVRGYDLANITFIKGRRGWIVFDPLTSKETAKAALDLVEKNLGKRRIKAVIYSHSHVDHFGGVKGIVSEEQVRKGKVEIIAPEGFMHHAIAENVLAGNAMSRRSTYQYGTLLPPGEKGHMDAAIGKSVSTGTVTLIPPTITINKTPTRVQIDGVEMIFQYTPNTEAPAEMTTYFPKYKAFWAAEVCTATVHNVYTLRGAEVRNPGVWSKYINEALDLFGNKTEVVFASHTWPRWGNREVVNYLKKQRDLYGYINDQTLRLINHGYTMVEIAEMLEVPESLSQEWFNRGYHGTYNHDIKGVYQKYLGWYNSNPATLHPFPPAVAAKKYVAYMGGAKKVIEMAKRSYNKGDYRWVAEVMNHVVLAYPNNKIARNLQADALEQLGYQAEGAGWRNSYLMAAKELRDGVMGGISTKTASQDTIKAMNLSMFFDFMGVRLNGKKAIGKEMVFNVSFPDVKERYVLNLENSHLSYLKNRVAEKVDADIRMNRSAWDQIVLKQATLDEKMKSGEIQIIGNSNTFNEFLGLMDEFKFWFNIVTPNPPLDSKGVVTSKIQKKSPATGTVSSR